MFTERLFGSGGEVQAALGPLGSRSLDLASWPPCAAVFTTQLPATVGVSDRPRVDLLSWRSAIPL